MSAPSLAPELSAADKAAVLVEALPYLRRFRGRTVVVKYGGNAMGVSGTGPGGPQATDPQASFAEDVVLLHAVGLRVVVVHGGGPQIGELMARLGKVPAFVDGLRVTDAETLDIVRMVLVGRVNRDLVGALNRHGPLAVGVSGEDGALLQVTERSPDLGFVGDVDRVEPGLLERLLASDLVPVVATIGRDAVGQAYNVNADPAAAAIAAALGAEKLVYLTDVAGIRSDPDDPATLLSSVTASALEDLVAGGAVNAGMVPKAEGCMAAVRAGVGHAHVLDGRLPHALLLEVFTSTGIGTMVTA